MASQFASHLVHWSKESGKTPLPALISKLSIFMQILFAYSAFLFFGLYTPVWLLRFPELGLKIRNWINFWKLLKVYQSQLQSGYLEECSWAGFPHGYSRMLKVIETDKAVPSFVPPACYFAANNCDCAIKLMTPNLASANRLPRGNNNYHKS